VEDDPVVRADGDDVLPAGARDAAGLGGQQRPFRLGVGAGGGGGGGVAGEVGAGAVGPGRGHQDGGAGVVHGGGCLAPALLLGAVLLEQPDGFALERQAVGGDALQVEPGVGADGVAVVLVQQVRRAVDVGEGGRVDGAALVRGADQRPVADRFERSGGRVGDG